MDMINVREKIVCIKNISPRHHGEVSSMIKVYKISNIPGVLGVYGHICPVCGAILSDSDDPYMLPEFSTCDCDKVEKSMGNKEDYNFNLVFGTQNTYSVFRNKYPQLCAIYDGEKLRMIEVLEQCDVNDEDKRKAVEEMEEYIHSHIQQREPVYYLRQLIDGYFYDIRLTGTKEECEKAIETYPEEIRGQLSVVHEYDHRQYASEPESAI